jgi:hypothetical protein
MCSSLGDLGDQVSEEQVDLGKNMIGKVTVAELFLFKTKLM